jgi:hypothetical protein
MNFQNDYEEEFLPVHGQKSKKRPMRKYGKMSGFGTDAQHGLPGSASPRPKLLRNFW